MISVIICSRGHDIPVVLRNNIETTIGIEHELIIIDNSQNKHDIFTAYNEGVRSAQGDILCFMHDDVLFRTQDWGRIIHGYFEKEEEIGVIGFAGAHFLPDVPLYWDESPFISEHDLTTRDGKTEKCFQLGHFADRDLVEVAVIDGMCFFVKKSLFNHISFDEVTFQGFHLYDMDISMQAKSVGYKVCVCKTVLIEHFYSFSPTKPGFSLFELNLQKFFKKWSSYFPMVVGVDEMSEGMIVQMNNYVKETVKLKRLYKNTLQSKAFRFGKAILYPFKKLRGNQ